MAFQLVRGGNADWHRLLLVVLCLSFGRPLGNSPQHVELQAPVATSFAFKMLGNALMNGRQLIPGHGWPGVVFGVIIHIP